MTLLFARHTSVIIIGLLLSMMLNGSVTAKTVTDQIGRTFAVPDTPERIIALAPSITEIIFDLHMEEKLVGATQFSTYPPEAAKIPRVGSYVRLDIEKIVTLKPDLCLAIKDGNPKHVIDRIIGLGIPVYVINPQNLLQVMDTITRLGILLHAEEAAGELVADMRTRIDRISSRARQAACMPRIFFQIDADPLFSAGSDTFIDEMIELAGGINAAAGDVPYPRYSWEDIIVLQPEIVLISSMAGGLAPEDLVRSWQRWQQLSAVSNGFIFVVEADLFDRPTPRLVRGLETIAAIIHPELFADDKSSNRKLPCLPE